MTTIAQKPNAFLTKQTVALEGRKLKDGDQVWSKAGKVLLVSRLRTNTHRVVATHFDQNVLGNTWWSFDAGELSHAQVKSILLCLNSSIGILSYFGARAITQGAWVQMKKPAWESMLVLDVRKLREKQLLALATAYDTLATQGLQALAQLDIDPVRIKIDEAICKQLGITSLRPVRELLAREPGLTGHAAGTEH